MTTNNPRARLTKVPAGADPSGIPSISNTRSRPTTRPTPPIVSDLAYLRSLGPGPLPWEEKTANVSPSSVGDGSLDH